MIEWKKTLLGYTLETSRYSADVWTYNAGVEYGSRWRYTVFNLVEGRYVDSGTASSLDKATEICLRVMGI